MKAAVTNVIVLDASVALAWCFEDESSLYSEHVLDLLAKGGECRVPAIWPFEVANALLVAERRKRITTAQAAALTQRVGKLPIVVEAAAAERAFGEIMHLARQTQLTEYDAAYLELAVRAGLPIATLDAKLRKAASTLGIEFVN